MDRDTLLDYLAKAERRVAEAEAHIKRQRQILAELERYADPEDVRIARKLLATFEMVQVFLVAES